MPQVIPEGLACQSGLRVGDRILEVNTMDMRHATHQEAVRALLANKQEIRLLVRRDPSPPGMEVGQGSWGEPNPQTMAWVICLPEFSLDVGNHSMFFIFLGHFYYL